MKKWSDIFQKEPIDPQKVVRENGDGTGHAPNEAPKPVRKTPARPTTKRNAKTR